MAGSLIDLNDTTPAAPEGGVNVKWQADPMPALPSTRRRVSAYIDKPKVKVSKAGTIQGTRPEINFIEGSNVSLTVADDAANDRVSVTITSTATGSGSGDTGVGITLFKGISGMAPTKSGTGLTTAINQSSTFSATDVTDAGIFLDDPVSNSGERIEGIAAAYPASAFTLTAVMSVPGGANNNCAGIVLAQSATGKMMFFGSRWGNSQTGWTAMNFNSPSSWNSFISPFSAGAPQAYFSSALLGVRIQDDGTNITVWFSVDGYGWTQVYRATKASTFLGTGNFNYIGFVVDTNAGPCSSMLLAWDVV